ncbi:hypothetical protein C8Q74DRAFT_380826 [Fomes fomentarius]|nr:hypothetical protein C8Q74DRAFT_380826 [Fomes fomentarius]
MKSPLYSDWLPSPVGLQLEDEPQASVQSPATEVVFRDQALQPIPYHSQYDPSTFFDLDVSPLPSRDAYPSTPSFDNHKFTLASALPAGVGVSSCSLPSRGERCVSFNTLSYLTNRPVSHASDEQVLGLGLKHNVAGYHPVLPIASASSEEYPPSSIHTWTTASSPLTALPNSLESIPSICSGLTTLSAGTPFVSSIDPAAISGSSSAICNEIPQKLYTRGITRGCYRAGTRRTVSYGPSGFSIEDAFAEQLQDLAGSEDTAFPGERLGQKPSVRIEFAGYNAYARQVNVLLRDRRCMDSEWKQPTKGRLAIIVAREVKKFLDKNDNFSDDYPWERLVLLHVDIVSKGTLQPRIGVKMLSS